MTAEANGPDESLRAGELTGRQKRFLRSLGQRLSPAVVIGRAGAAEASIRTIRCELDRRELIKVRLPAGAAGRGELTASLAGRAGAALAGQVGRTALLYRPNPDIPADKRIDLPA